MLASTFLRPDGGVLVSCDISGNMVRNLSKIFSQEWTQIPGNKFEIDVETDFLTFGEDLKLKNTVSVSEIVAA